MGEARLETLQEVEGSKSDGGVKATEARLETLQEVAGSECDGRVKVAGMGNEMSGLARVGSERRGWDCVKYEHQGGFIYNDPSSYMPDWYVKKGEGKGGTWGDKKRVTKGSVAEWREQSDWRVEHELLVGTEGNDACGQGDGNAS
ncbi:hypothetical protein EDB89DRAFT_1909442 [Lactarius sanguifluus]|nr:hypothetical protein EDB89DRAFT_1909442 [Lactarius sanguifluus]